MLNDGRRRCLLGVNARVTVAGRQLLLVLAGPSTTTAQTFQVRFEQVIFAVLFFSNFVALLFDRRDF